MKTTRIFDRLPSDAGVTFEGFENIKIRSREDVRNKLEEFIEYCKIAKKPAIRFILGEWGEGKTDAYRRYMQPKCQADGNYTLFVSASTLSNGYEAPNVKKLLETTSLSAIRFLVVLFNCAREESKEARIPEIEKYKDAYEYLRDVLKNLIGEKKTKRIFIFIDEFEELLLNPPRLREIISGIKEVINGGFVEIDENGEYEGCVHFIVAVTPDAFYQLQIDKDLSLIFGGLGRRAGIIELPQIRKRESIEFLYSLLKYSYGDNLPEQLPFENLGIFNALFRITQGNPGSLVSLFTRLMSSSKSNDKIKVIDYEHFLKFLEKEYIFVYGGSTPCLETETFNRFLKVVEEQKSKETGQKCKSLLKLLCGELKPFSTDEIRSRLGINKEGELKNIISIINNNLKEKEKIDVTILKVCPLREEKSFDDVLEALKEYRTVEKDKKYIKIDNYSEELESFEDRITYFSIENNKLVPRIYLPSNSNSLMSFFEGITPDRAKELENLFRRKLCKDEDYYLISDEILSQIFPTPVPKELEFIKNREARMKLWRDITKNLTEQYEKYMPEAFIKMLEESKTIKLVKYEKYGSKSIIAELEIPEIDGLKINSLFYSVNGDVKSSDIEELYQIMKGTKPPIHCIILIYTGEITDEAEEKIINKELGKEGENIILDVRLHPTLAKRILGIYNATSLQDKDIDRDLKKRIIEKIVTQELDFPNRLKSWLNSQKEKGVVIANLSISATPNLREFVDALKFYINFIEEGHTDREIFDKNKDKLLRFIKYESKIGLIPDIDFPKFSKISKDLESNGFLQKSGDKYFVSLHPVEKRILAILEKGTKLLRKELESYFIVKDKKLLKEVFLPILEYKGLIKCDKDICSLSNRNELFNKVEKNYQKFKQQLNKYQDYGYILMTKERGHRFITLREFDNLIEELYKIVENEMNNEVVIQKLSLLEKLLQHFEEFLPLFDNADKEAKKILESVHSTYNDLTDKIDKIRNECDKLFKLQFSVESIEEYERVKKKLEDIEKSAKYGYDEMTKEVEKLIENRNILDTFSFRKSDEDAFYFNPKLYIISNKASEFNEIVKDIGNCISELLDKHFRTLNDKQKKVESKIREKTFPEKNRISNSFLERLKQLTREIFPELQPTTLNKPSLKYICEYVKQHVPLIDSMLEDVSKCLDRLDEISEKEQSLLSMLEESERLSKHILSIFDIKGYDVVARDFENEVDAVRNKYYGIDVPLQDAKALLQKMNEIKNKLDSLIKTLEEKKQSINEKWVQYSRELSEYIDNINYTLQLLKRHYEISSGDIETELEKLRKNIDVRQILEIKLKFSEIEYIKDQIHRKFYSVITPLLEEKELRVLETVVKKVRNRKKWVPVQELESELNIQAEEVNEIVQKLIKKRLLRGGVSLAF